MEQATQGLIHCHGGSGVMWTNNTYYQCLQFLGVLGKNNMCSDCDLRDSDRETYNEQTDRRIFGSMKKYKYKKLYTNYTTLQLAVDVTYIPRKTS
jgi:hypothetical protein